MVDNINYQEFCKNMVYVPISEKYTLTIEEASKYFRIGENKLRKLAEENLNASWVLMNGNRIQIKRKQFEKIIDTLNVI
jgi:excisionase family DNA binding protein